jgi:hypothetical protein
MENELKMAVSGGERRSVNRSAISDYDFADTIWMLLVGVFIVLIDVWSIFLFGFGYGGVLVLIMVSLLVYAGLLWFLNSYNSVRVIASPARINVPLENREEKEVYEKPFIIDDSIHADLEAAMGADYIGSIKNRTYHLSGCRLAKLIKPEFKLENTNIDFFKKRKFKACKICLKKSKQRNSNV